MVHLQFSTMVTLFKTAFLALIFVFFKAPAGRGAPAARGAPAKGAAPTAAKSNSKAEPEPTPAPAPEPETPKPAPSAGPAPINRKTYHPRLGLARAHKAANEIADSQKYYNEVIVMSPEVGG